MATKNERVYKAFKEENDLPVHHDVPFRPKGGYQYFFEWNTADDKENWRADGYRWKQNGKATYNYLDVEFIKIYFKILVGPDKYATSFSRTAFINTAVPNRVFVWYEGDDNVAIDLPHGNAKHSSKRNSVYQRTKPSVLAQLKSSEKRPSEVYNDILASTTPEVAHAGVNIPRDVKQVQNARRRLQPSRTGDRTRPSSTTNTEGYESELDFDDRGDGNGDVPSYGESSAVEHMEVGGNYVVIESSHAEGNPSELGEVNHLEPEIIWDTSPKMKDVAKRIVDQNEITLVPSRRVWLVESSARWPFMVSLFEKSEFRPRCTCKEKKICCHIAAAMLSVGYQPSSNKTFTSNGRARSQAKRRRPEKASNGQPDRTPEEPSPQKRTSVTTDELPWGLLG